MDFSVVLDNLFGERCFSRNFCFSERSSSNKGEISECADRAGSKVLGLQVELNKVKIWTPYSVLISGSRIC